MIAVRAARRIAVGDAVALAFENTDTLTYQVQEMLMVESVSDESAIAHELQAYSLFLPSHDSLTATMFIEADDVASVKDELIRLTGIQHCVSLLVEGAADGAAPDSELLRAPGVEIPTIDEDGPSTVTQAVHFLRFTLSTEARAAFCNPQSPAYIAIEHPLYNVRVPISGATRTSLIADLQP